MPSVLDRKPAGIVTEGAEVEEVVVLDVVLVVGVGVTIGVVDELVGAVVTDTVVPPTVTVVTDDKIDVTV